jgi:hypothetical protein
MKCTIPYNKKLFNFIEVVEDLFETSDLSILHTLANQEYKEIFEVGKDSSTIFHHKFYGKYHNGWPHMEGLYEAFVVAMIPELYNEGILYQKFPTVRFHLPNNIAVGGWHNDAEYHHPEGEMNFIIPLTLSDDTASIWVESKPGKKDFSAVRLKPGELFMFSGNNLTHGNKVNETGKTRVSMDFRVLPLSKYNEKNDVGSMTLGTKFREGEYYKRLKI